MRNERHGFLRLLVHDDVNLITVPPLGDIVSFRVTVTALSRFINNFRKRAQARNGSEDGITHGWLRLISSVFVVRIVESLVVAPGRDSDERYR